MMKDKNRAHEVGASGDARAVDANQITVLTQAKLTLTDLICTTSSYFSKENPP